ncbi:transmembrane protein, putative (macronuclear) [Tetrahymena thermophila SB210]|uniref:Transmembrane protein, putative n=1 Tax=Tetrahymena thermophila (strain SB210) TaxID=312017 RepID=Q22P64_TETTS|nr:transmembrane protein, putative [Tetrahymena thermophila SB210]EAR86947.2 transmembrane protein, putative [Tetrahymena thermophila SB210]|eukprot:XP_001007192.2 transmembrane protein, putative [Tetrahymena thermophila SB210]
MNNQFQYFYKYQKKYLQIIFDYLFIKTIRIFTQLLNLFFEFIQTYKLAYFKIYSQLKMMSQSIQSLMKCMKMYKPHLMLKQIQNFSALNEKEFQTIYKQESNDVRSYSLIGASFLSTLLTDQFVVPMALSGIGFTTLLTSSFFVNEIQFNQQDQQMILKQNRRMLVFRPNKQTIKLNQLNVMYLGSSFAIININNDDAMKTYLLPLSKEDNKYLIQLLQQRKNL